MPQSLPTKPPNQNSNEHISLNSNDDTEIQDEEAEEVSSPKGTPEQPKRGRKSEKKRREEQANKEVALGIQHTIPRWSTQDQELSRGKHRKVDPLPLPNK
jgi:hypothetical protein